MLLRCYLATIFSASGLSQAWEYTTRIAKRYEELHRDRGSIRLKDRVELAARVALAGIKLAEATLAFLPIALSPITPNPIPIASSPEQQVYDKILRAQAVIHLSTTLLSCLIDKMHGEKGDGVIVFEAHLRCLSLLFSRCLFLSQHHTFWANRDECITGTVLTAMTDLAAERIQTVYLSKHLPSSSAPFYSFKNQLDSSLPKTIPPEWENHPFLQKHLCPISLAPIRLPVVWINPKGHPFVYDYDSLKLWIQQTSKDRQLLNPSSNEQISIKEIQIHLSLLHKIERVMFHLQQLERSHTDSNTHFLEA